jgi:hypothetical protein
MPSIFYRLELPPVGIEITGDGTSPTDAQMAEEQAARDAFVASLGPKVEAILARGPHREGNVTCVELLGASVWSELNQYLLTVTVDIGRPGIDFDTLLPAGSTATEIGAYREVQRWPASADVVPPE